MTKEKTVSAFGFKPDEIVIISTERKQLPVPNAKYFKQEFAEDFVDFGRLIKKYTPSSKDISDPETEIDNSKKVIVIDSFTRVLSMMSTWLDKIKKIKGYTFWAKYAEHASDLLMKSMMTNKWLIWMAIDDITVDSDGDKMKSVKIKGNEMKGLVESFFTVVLWTHVEKKEPNASKRYKFITNSDGSNNAKTPIGMFKNQYIDNDILKVMESISKYYKFDPNDFETKRPNILIVGRSGSGKSTSLRNLITITD